jgi:long-chain fatty acid transport protein
MSVRCRLPSQILAVIAIVIATVGPSTASPLFELVGDVQDDGGLNARVTADGASAAYYNPALLADSPTGFELGIFVFTDQISISVDGRRSSPVCMEGECDVQSDGGGRGPQSFRHGTGEQVAISDPTIPTDWLQDGTDDIPARPRQGAGSGQNVRAYQTVGLVTPIFRGRLTLGLYAMIPLGEFTTAKAFYNDEREQFFSNSLHPELYSDRLTATSLAFGGGFRLNRRLAFGATFTLALANKAAVPVYVSNLEDLDTVRLDSDIGVEASVSPHFGAVYDPTDRLRLTATVHTQQAFEIDTGFTYFLSTGSENGTTLKFTHSFIPLTLAMGGSWTLGDVHDRPLTLVATALYARWSDYKDRHSESPTESYAWTDTIAGALGLRWRMGALHGLADLGYQPSPVPPQTGRSNYVDNDRIATSAGVEYEFNLWGSRFRAGISAQAHRLFSRHQTKFVPPVDAADGEFPELVRDEIPDDSIDLFNSPVPNRDGLQTNNPGFPGFGSEGWLFGSGVNIAVLY